MKGIRALGGWLSFLFGMLLLGATVAWGDGFDLASRYRAVFEQPPAGTPSNTAVDAPLLGNGDLLVALGGKPAAPRFYIQKNDLWRMPVRGGAAPRPLARLDLDIPSLAGASYRVEQTLGDAVTTAVFETNGRRLTMRCWVAATRPFLVIELSARGGGIPVATRLNPGGLVEAPISRLRNTGRRINLGREQYGKGRWYLHGGLDDVRIYDRALTAGEIARLKAGGDLPDGLVRHWTFDAMNGDTVPDRSGHGGDGRRVGGSGIIPGVRGNAVALDGRDDYVECPPLNLARALTVSAFVRIDGDTPWGGAQYIVSQGEWKNGWSLGLSGGRLRLAVGSVYLQAPDPIPRNRWVHAAGVFDGKRLSVYVDGRKVEKALDPSEADAAGETRGVSWVVRRFEKGMRTPAAAACGYRVLEGRRRLVVVEPGRPVTLLAAVQSSFDDPAFDEKVIQILRDISDASDLTGIRRDHEAWWRDYWNKSFVHIPDPFLEQRYYLSLYGLGSASRNRSFPPGIFGWVTTDSPAWNGDYHMNYNFVAPFYGLGVANRIEQLDPCVQPILDAEAPCRNWCRESLHIEGIYMPVGIGPKGCIGHSALMQKSNASYACVPIAERWYTTYDPAFARKAYSYVEGVATFWENWLKWEPDGRGGGRYVDEDDAVHEKSGHDVNPIVSLALIRLVMNLALDMSAELGVDAGRRETWRRILAHLSPYPTCRLGDLKTWWPPHLPDTPANRNLPIFRYTEKGVEWWRNNTVGIQHIFPAGGVGLDSPPDLLERGRNQIRVMNRWFDFNGMNSFYAAAARVGYDPDAILENLRGMLKKHGGVNGMITGNPHGMEHFSIVPNAIQEMLMQSHEGVIRVFPDWPKGRSARFGTLRARGAFLVSSERKGDTVQYVKITSEWGRDCTMINPWPGKAVIVTGCKRSRILTGERFTFRTHAGETLTLKMAAGRKRERSDR